LPSPATGAVSLADHTAAVTANARAIAAKLDLPSDLQAAIIAAAEHHDDGKARTQWQHTIGNRDYPNTVLAKSTGGTRSTAETYRHEFGSLSWSAESPTASDIAIHLVAAHHGRARPNFPAAEIFDPERSPSESSDRADAVPLRFAALQHQYGRWGLAYLESILRATDYAASAGIVADAAHPSLATPSQIGQTTFTPKEVGTGTLALDPANPGHFFACCGFFELASRLYPDATAHFDGNRFILSAPTTLVDLFGKITAAPITTLDLDDATTSPLFIGKPFSVRIDWWKIATPATSALKVWAGTMEAPRIAKAMQKAIDASKGGQLLFAPRIAYDVADATKKVEPFYFDANRGPNSDSRDVGFSPNDLGLETLATPAVEFLCLIGLQRAIPHPVDDRLFDYHLWTMPIPVFLIAAAVNGFIQPEKHSAFRFESWYRTSQRKHKAFLTAKPIHPQTKELIK
jgi:CRISPR-associated endonuclease/helicase Cas3